MGFLDRLLGGGVDSLNAQQAREAIDAGAVLIDVRTTREWNAGHAPFATHVPMDQLDRRLNRVTTGQQVVVVCRSGTRSRAVCRQLASAGYDARNLAGGLRAWDRAGLPLVDNRGRPGVVTEE
jgi:rhodanese-related sulfurtransferase